MSSLSSPEAPPFSKSYAMTLQAQRKGHGGTLPVCHTHCPYLDQDFGLRMTLASDPHRERADESYLG